MTRLFLALIMSMVLISSALAEKRELLGSYKDWDAFKDTKPDGSAECYMRSEPTKWKASKSGVRRGETYMTVVHSEARRVRNQIYVVGGFTFKEGSDVSAKVGSAKYSLFTVADAAWMERPKDEAAMVNSMRRGSTLTVVGQSTRGTTLTDTYSLSGFTAAYNAISKACRS